ncbi:hypothetical protein [Empedobacter tilapiae]|uniref:hypothetical protein n=1 Tax=Empedobacter tilapiae TaxID=2491114 RepID=UPI0028D681D1|nr:hypothetical protein [Empedobacter tilapiae]
MKKTLLIIIASISIFTNAQIGVNTSSPKSSLDVNGDFGLRKRLYLDNSGKESKGLADQVLVSQGESLPPTWKSLRVPEYEPNKFYLIFNDSFSDNIGLQITSSQVFTNSNLSTDLAENQTLSYLRTKGFYDIKGLSKSFTVNSSESKVYFQFETVVQQNNSNNGSDIKYACGIFVDGLLKSVRINTLFNSASGHTFLTHTQIGGATNLAVGPHKIDVACARYTTNTDITLGIGINSSGSVNINSFMAQSSLKVDVYEIPQNFNTIFD